MNEKDNLVESFSWLPASCLYAHGTFMSPETLQLLVAFQDKRQNLLASNSEVSVSESKSYGLRHYLQSVITSSLGERADKLEFSSFDYSGVSGHPATRKYCQASVISGCNEFLDRLPFEWYPISEIGHQDNNNVSSRPAVSSLLRLPYPSSIPREAIEIIERVEIVSVNDRNSCGAASTARLFPGSSALELERFKQAINDAMQGSIVGKLFMKRTVTLDPAPTKNGSYRRNRTCSTSHCSTPQGTASQLQSRKVFVAFREDTLPGTILGPPIGGQFHLDPSVCEDTLSTTADLKGPATSQLASLFKRLAIDDELRGNKRTEPQALTSLQNFTWGGDVKKTGRLSSEDSYFAPSSILAELTDDDGVLAHNVPGRVTSAADQMKSNSGMIDETAAVQHASGPAAEQLPNLFRKLTTENSIDLYQQTVEYNCRREFIGPLDSIPFGALSFGHVRNELCMVKPGFVSSNCVPITVLIFGIPYVFLVAGEGATKGREATALSTEPPNLSVPNIWGTAPKYSSPTLLPLSMEARLNRASLLRCLEEDLQNRATIMLMAKILLWDSLMDTSTSLSFMDRVPSATKALVTSKQRLITCLLPTWRSIGDMIAECPIVAPADEGDNPVRAALGRVLAQFSQVILYFESRLSTADLPAPVQQTIPAASDEYLNSIIAQSIVGLLDFRTLLPSQAAGFRKLLQNVQESTDYLTNKMFPTMTFFPEIDFSSMAQNLIFRPLAQPEESFSSKSTESEPFMVRNVKVGRIQSLYPPSLHSPSLPRECPFISRPPNKISLFGFYSVSPWLLPDDRFRSLATKKSAFYRASSLSSNVVSSSSSSTHSTSCDDEDGGSDSEIKIVSPPAQVLKSAVDITESAILTLPERPAGLHPVTAELQRMIKAQDKISTPKRDVSPTQQAILASSSDSELRHDTSESRKAHKTTAKQLRRVDKKDAPKSRKQNESKKEAYSRNYRRLRSLSRQKKLPDDSPRSLDPHHRHRRQPNKHIRDRRASRKSRSLSVESRRKKYRDDTEVKRTRMRPNSRQHKRSISRHHSRSYDPRRRHHRSKNITKPRHTSFSSSSVAAHQRRRRSNSRGNNSNNNNNKTGKYKQRSRRQREDSSSLRSYDYTDSSNRNRKHYYENRRRRRSSTDSSDHHKRISSCDCLYHRCPHNSLNKTRPSTSRASRSIDKSQRHHRRRRSRNNQRKREDLQRGADDACRSVTPGKGNSRRRRNSANKKSCGRSDDENCHRGRKKQSKERGKTGRRVKEATRYSSPLRCGTRSHEDEVNAVNCHSIERHEKRGVLESGKDDDDERARENKGGNDMSKYREKRHEASTTEGKSCDSFQRHDSGNLHPSRSDENKTTNLSSRQWESRTVTATEPRNTWSGKNNNNQLSFRPSQIAVFTPKMTDGSQNSAGDTKTSSKYAAASKSSQASDWKPESEDAFIQLTEAEQWTQHDEEAQERGRAEAVDEMLERVKTELQNGKAIFEMRVWSMDHFLTRQLRKTREEVRNLEPTDAKKAIAESQILVLNSKKKGHAICRVDRSTAVITGKSIPRICTAGPVAEACVMRGPGKRDRGELCRADEDLSVVQILPLYDAVLCGLKNIMARDDTFDIERDNYHRTLRGKSGGNNHSLQDPKEDGLELRPPVFLANSYSIDVWIKLPAKGKGPYRSLLATNNMILVGIFRNTTICAVTTGEKDSVIYEPKYQFQGKTCTFNLEVVAPGWHRLILTDSVKDNHRKYYLDGYYIGTAPSCGPGAVEFIGCRGIGKQYFGAFARLIMYDRVLDVSEICQSYGIPMILSPSHEDYFHQPVDCA